MAERLWLRCISLQGYLIRYLFIDCFGICVVINRCEVIGNCLQLTFFVTKKKSSTKTNTQESNTHTHRHVRTQIPISADRPLAKLSRNNFQFCPQQKIENALCYYPSVTRCITHQQHLHLLRWCGSRNIIQYQESRIPVMRTLHTGQ